MTFDTRICWQSLCAMMLMVWSAPTSGWARDKRIGLGPKVIYCALRPQAPFQYSHLEGHANKLLNSTRYKTSATRAIIEVVEVSVHHADGALHHYGDLSDVCGMRYSFAVHDQKRVVPISMESALRNRCFLRTALKDPHLERQQEDAYPFPSDRQRRYEFWDTQTHFGYSIAESKASLGPQTPKEEGRLRHWFPLDRQDLRAFRQLSVSAFAELDAMDDELMQLPWGEVHLSHRPRVYLDSQNHVYPSVSELLARGNLSINGDKMVICYADRTIEHWEWPEDPGGMRSSDPD